LRSGGPGRTSIAFGSGMNAASLSILSLLRGTRRPTRRVFAATLGGATLGAALLG
jgi:hypothetical protein